MKRILDIRLASVFVGLILAGWTAVAAEPTPVPAPAVGPTLTAALAPEVTVLQGRLRERMTPDMTAGAPGALPRVSATLAETWLALAAVQLEKATDYLNATPAEPDQAGACLAAARELLAAQTPTAPPQLVRHGKLVELAYFTRDDASPQPYFLYVPTTYAAGKPAPLVVFLHGYVPETSRTIPYLISDFVIDQAEKYGALFVLPHGRTNTDFQYVGETDVLRVKAEVEKFWSIDPDRVSLLGVSMGGAGVWQVATHYPDLWAGIAPINGQADWFTFWARNFKYPPRAELPRHIAYQIALNNPLDLVRNLSALYSYSQHATLCFVGVGHTQAMAAKLKDLGAPYDFFEDPSKLGHYIYWQPPCWERAFEHLMAQTRPKAPPATVRYATYSLRFPGAYWVRIGDIRRWGTLASVEARRTEPGRIEVTSENANTIVLTPPRDWAAADGTFAVTWNGNVMPPRKPEADGRITLKTVFTPRLSPRKNTAVCGPAADVFNFPFIAVRGTTGSEAETAALAQLATQFADDWNRYAEGRVTILRDTDVTPELMQAKGLVLFGLPETNAVIGRVADKLPLKLSRTETVLPDGKRFPAAGTGLILTYPNPLAPQRYLLIVNGQHWGEGRGQNHKFDRIPDFTIFTAEPFPGIGSNHFLAAGLFDSNWQYDATLTDFADKP